MRRLSECLESDEWPGPPAPSAWRVDERKMLASRPSVSLTIGGQEVSV